MRVVTTLIAALPVLAVAAQKGKGNMEEFGIARIKDGVKVEGINAFWSPDKRYRNQPTLKPHSKVVVADLKGPGVITCIHMSQIGGLRDTGLLRGVVIEIYYDGEKEPAVLCPLPDFFCDGCNSRSTEFASKFTEKVPYAWNAYFPMPFKKSAKVVFRNDTDVDTMCYAFVEWETLPKWEPDLGYFHATYRRHAFRLTENTREEFFHVKGRGHVLGRQFSIATDEPSFRGFNFVVEGNNEVNVDGNMAFDYLGSEDSFTFSWGFNKLYSSPYAGMTYVVQDEAKSRLSIYRFHQHSPIRFEKEFQWLIDWKNEDEAFGKQSGWVDYASVFYWYQDVPAGFTHEPLAPVAGRCVDVLPEPGPKRP